jgi:hypothetical protein
MKEKIIVYGGRKYYSNPKGYFYDNRNKALHRQVWEDFHGAEIPEGYAVHHIDGDNRNNSADNLECILRSKHQSDHMKERWEKYPEKNKKNLDLAREKAKEWHGSKEGLAWHKENGKKSYKNRKKDKLVCIYCGKKYEAFGGMYCSNSCFQRKKYADKSYHEERKCLFCGKTFKTRRGEDTKCCSGKCGAKLRWSRS